MLPKQASAQPGVGAKHNSGVWAGTRAGLGQQMAAIEVVLGTMIQKMDAMHL